MQKSTKRAERRAHYFRLKKNRENYYGFNPRKDVTRNYYLKVVKLTEKEIEGILGFRVNTPTSCSCWGCGNPRRHFKCITLKEYKALHLYADGIEECFGYRPYFRKFTKWW